MKKVTAMILTIVLLASMVCSAMTSALAEDKVLFTKGDQNDDIVNIRARLIELQYMNAGSAGSKHFSDKLISALNSFQKKNNLPISDKITQSAYDLLFSDQCVNAYGIEWNEINRYTATSLYTLLGDEQYYAGKDGNVILIVLDTFYSTLFNTLLSKDEATVLNGFEDFTYYNNYDSCYYGTYPAMVHMLTGYDLRTDVTIGQWFHDAWTSDSANYFYDKLHAYGYGTYMYSVAPINCGFKSEALGKIDNLVRNADYKGKAVAGKTKQNFYTSLQKKGVTAVEGKRFIVQHLMGMHYPYDVSANGSHVANSTTVNNGFGWLVITKAYLQALKEAGVYDNSTIIIAADHGSKLADGMQSLFLIKEAGKSGTKMQQTNAPASHDEMISTILYSIGVPKDELPGKTIFDFVEDQERERTIYINQRIDSFGKKTKYNGSGYGSHNVWLGYTYEGNLNDLKKRIKRGATDKLPMNQSFN